MTVIGVRIDDSCDECGAREAGFTVVDQGSRTIYLTCDNCGHEVDMDDDEFDEYLRDEGDTGEWE